MNKNNNNALILMAKAPRVGTVKTRLQPELTVKDSVLLYRAMVEDIVRQLTDVSFYDLKIFFHPADAFGEMKIWLGDEFEYYPQQGNDLGEKMNNAINEILNQKYNNVAVVGSDIPTLNATTIARAFSGLDNFDMVLGPCNDGGYYLIGMKQAHPDIFEQIPWSTNLVLNRTIEKARLANLEIVQLEKKSDIDTYRELYEFWTDLKRRAIKQPYPVNSKTYQVLKTLLTL